MAVTPERYAFARNNPLAFEDPFGNRAGSAIDWDLIRSWSTAFGAGPTYQLRDTCRRNGWDAKLQAALASALKQIKKCDRSACTWSEYKDARIAALQHGLYDCPIVGEPVAPLGKQMFWEGLETFDFGRYEVIRDGENRNNLRTPSSRSIRSS
jgi:hypothetical protein